MNDASEITILKEGNVKITNLRVIIGMKTYATSNITSVNMRVNEPKLFIPVFFAVNMGICSILVAISNMEAYAQCLQTGLYTGVAGLLFFLVSRKTKYNAHITSSAGELRILEANDRDYVQRIVKAIREAIVMRG